METPLLVGDFLRRAAKLYPNKVAVVDGDGRYTYAQFQDRANQLGHALLELGVKQGDRVCILSPNSHFFLESYYGVTQIGAILVPLNYRLVAADHAGREGPHWLEFVHVLRRDLIERTVAPSVICAAHREPISVFRFFQSVRCYRLVVLQNRR